MRVASLPYSSFESTQGCFRRSYSLHVVQMLHCVCLRFRIDLIDPILLKQIDFGYAMIRVFAPASLAFGP